MTAFHGISLLSSSRATRGNNGTRADPFELFGKKATAKEFVRFMYGILDQLLPALERDLYEDIDGQKLSLTKQLNPEDSLRVPGAVKMHREANTSDNGFVFIKNHFDRSDLVNFKPATDMGIAYNDQASVNKSNGMVTESHAFLSEQLNFGTPMRTNSGVNVTMLNTTVFSHVTLIETRAFNFAEAEMVRIQYSFVKLVEPGAKNTYQPSNSSQKSTNSSTYAQNISSPLDGSLTRRKRSISETFKKRIKLFHKEVIGIDISGEGKVWVEAKVKEAMEIGVEVILKFGDLAVEVLHRTYEWRAGTKAETSVDKKWSKTIVSFHTIKSNTT